MDHHGHDPDSQNMREFCSNLIYEHFEILFLSPFEHYTGKKFVWEKKISFK